MLLGLVFPILEAPPHRCREEVDTTDRIVELHGGAVSFGEEVGGGEIPRALRVLAVVAADVSRKSDR